MKTKDEYLKAHNESGLGWMNDVVVKRTAEEDEEGWNNEWLESMDEYVGKQGVIVSDNDYLGFEVKFDDGFCCEFPYFVLELA